MFQELPSYCQKQVSSSSSFVAAPLGNAVAWVVCLCRYIMSAYRLYHDCCMQQPSTACPLHGNDGTGLASQALVHYTYNPGLTHPATCMLHMQTIRSDVLSCTAGVTTSCALRRSVRTALWPLTACSSCKTTIETSIATGCPDGTPPGPAMYPYLRFSLPLAPVMTGACNHHSLSRRNVYTNERRHQAVRKSM